MCIRDSPHSGLYPPYFRPFPLFFHRLIIDLSGTFMVISIVSLQTFQFLSWQTCTWNPHCDLFDVIWPLIGSLIFLDCPLLLPTKLFSNNLKLSVLTPSLLIIVYWNTVPSDTMTIALYEKRVPPLWIGLINCLKYINVGNYINVLFFYTSFLALSNSWFLLSASPCPH